MKVSIISGSNRANSESLRVAQYLKERASTLYDFQPTLIDLHATPISVSPDDNYGGKKDPHFKAIADSIRESDALVLVSPEWGGSASPMLRALLIFIGEPAAYKPALIATVSSGRGGAFPVSELKASGNKNNFLTFLPEYLIFRNVNSLLKTKDPETEDDRYIRERSDYALGLLFAFAKALQTVRSSGALNLKKYPFGM